MDLVTHRHLIRSNCPQYGMDLGKLNRGPCSDDREKSKYIYSWDCLKLILSTSNDVNTDETRDSIIYLSQTRN